MTNENVQPTVGQMLRMTGSNNADFLEQVAIHVEKLESEVARLEKRVTELEGNSRGSE
jgi:outer membrane murein-binding lipoprotein Lpp